MWWWSEVVVVCGVWGVVGRHMVVDARLNNQPYKHTNNCYLCGCVWWWWYVVVVVYGVWGVV